MLPSWQQTASTSSAGPRGDTASSLALIRETCLGWSMYSLHATCPEETLAIKRHKETGPSTNVSGVRP